MVWGLHSGLQVEDGLISLHLFLAVSQVLCSLFSRHPGKGRVPGLDLMYEQRPRQPWPSPRVQRGAA